MLDPRNLPPHLFATRAGELQVEERSVRRLVVAVVGRGVFDPLVWGRQFQVPRKLQECVANPLPRLSLEHSVTSSVDGFQKLLFRTGDGLPLETVLIPLHKPGAVSVCLSSQVGCAMGCVFCATARMTSRRNLEAWEIVDQFIQAREIVRSQGRRITGAVFMGMGEPFLVYDSVIAAAELLRCPFGGQVAAKAITICDRRHCSADRPLHTRATQVSTCDQPWRGDRREAGPARSGRRALAGGGGHGGRASECPGAAGPSDAGLRLYLGRECR